MERTTERYIRKGLEKSLIPSSEFQRIDCKSDVIYLEPHHKIVTEPNL